MQLYTYTCSINIDAIIKTREDFFKRIYPSLYLKGCVCESELETEQDCNILTPLMAISFVSFSFSKGAQPETRGLSFLLGGGFLYHNFSPISLISNSLNSCLHRVI